MARRKKSRNQGKPPPPFQNPRETADYATFYIERPLNWSTDSPSIWLFPIRWFASDVDELDLGASKIRRLRSEDIDAMRAVQHQPTITLFGTSAAVAVSGLPSLGPGRWDDFTDRPLPWVLQVDVPPGEFEKAYESATYLRRTAEAVLRIVGGHYVWLSDPVVFQPNVENSLLGENRLARTDFEPAPRWAHYRLTHDRSPMVQAIHGAALGTDDDRVKIALRRNYLGHGGGDDDIIDLWIGLEALFSDGASEITYKAAIRISHYIGQNQVARRFLFETLKESYTVRSRLVHGEHPRDTRRARQIASEALRLSLLKLLSEGTAAPDVPGLDRAIAAGRA